jgi:chemotaxis-related protein WspD
MADIPEQPRSAEPDLTTEQPLIQSDHALARMRRLLDRPLSQRDLEENTRLVAQRVDESRGTDQGVSSILVFRVGAERLALDAEATHRVVPVSPVRRVPHRSNETFAGVANIGGELLLVARLGPALGLSAQEKSSHFIVIGGVGARWAFAADVVEGVRRVRRAELVPPPATVRHAIDGCAQSVYREPNSERGHSILTVLDSAKVCALFARSIA